VSKDKGPPDGPQLFLPSLEALKRSPIWRQQQEAIAKLRESLPQPQYTPEQLRTPQLPADPVVDAIAARARTEAKQELEPEQVPKQQAIEQPPKQIEQPQEQPPKLKRRNPYTNARREQQWHPVAEPLPEETSEPTVAPTPGRPRHRPRVEFPHLPEALTDLEREPHFKSMRPNEERAFVVARLRHYGDKVENDEGKVMERTISRRINAWHKGTLVC
jgi:hypothetical protein